MNRSFALFVRYSLVAAALVAAFYSLLLARASWLFHQDTASSVPAAVRLVPFNSDYLSRLAAWKPLEKTALLERAVAVNPFDFESWIQLGLAREFGQPNDPAAAERCYLHAAEVNKMFLPKWTLTNFYFRRANEAEFFKWAKATLAITPYPPEPVFVQMWLITQDSAKIANAIPDRPRILLPYAWFLSNTQQYASLASIINRLMQAAGNKDPRAWGRDDLLANIEDRLLASRNDQLALDIWASMVKAGWLAENVPTADHPVTNPNFRAPFYRRGFDWIPVAVEGVTIAQFASNGQLRLQFSGDEPEHCILLEQYLPLEANRTYKFDWQADVQLADKPSGLRWHLHSSSSSVPSESVSPDLVGPSTSWIVKAPASGLARLTLDYARPLGTLRARGAVTLHSVSAVLQ